MGVGSAGDSSLLPPRDQDGGARNEYVPRDEQEGGEAVRNECIREALRLTETKRKAAAGRDGVFRGDETVLVDAELSCFASYYLPLYLLIY